MFSVHVLLIFFRGVQVAPDWYGMSVKDSSVELDSLVVGQRQGSMSNAG